MVEFFELLHVRFDFDGAQAKLAVRTSCRTPVLHSDCSNQLAYGVLAGVWLCPGNGLLPAHHRHTAVCGEGALAAVPAVLPHPQPSPLRVRLLGPPLLHGTPCICAHPRAVGFMEDVAFMSHH